MGNRNYNNQNYNNQNYQASPFQMQNPQPVKKKSKTVIIAVIVVIIAIAAAVGAIVFKIVSENAEESEREKKPYLGGNYVVKSKAASANSTAASVYAAVDTVLTELDEEGCDTGKIEYISHNKEDNFVDISGNSRGIDGERVYNKIEEYFSEAENIDFVAKIDNGCCTAVISASDESYWGTKPIVMRFDDYKNADSKFTIEDVMKKMEEEFGSEYEFDDYED